MTRTITLVLSTDSDDERFTIDDGETGLDIRSSGECKLQAGQSAVCDLEGEHCDACHDERDVADILGLTNDEAITLVRWRTLKQDGISSEVLGKILDKVVVALGRDAIECGGAGQRIVLKVEPTL